jgi:hypothetical protein
MRLRSTEIIDIETYVRSIVAGQFLPEVTVTTLPDPATNKRKLIYVSNETGGAQPAFSDGTNWRRLTDRAVVS